jgi:hypothetical protein
MELKSLPSLGWKNIGVTILPAIIAAVLGGSTLITFIISAFLTPNITIDFAIDWRNLNEAKFIIKNTGNAAAKNVILTVQAPYSITSHTIFSTENSTEVSSPNPKSLEVHVPRFVQGGGSLTEIDTVIDNKSNITTGEYRIYITYDQGSVSRIIPIVQRPFSINEEYSSFWNQYGTAITYLGAFVVFVPSARFILRYLARRRRASIRAIAPKLIRLQKENNLVTILGSKFGSKGSVWIEYYEPVSEEEKIYNMPPLSKKEKQKMKHSEIVAYEKKWVDEYRYYQHFPSEQYDVTPKTPREDNRIVVNLDSIKDKLKPQRYVVRVEKDGILTKINIDDMRESFQIIEH